LPPFAAGTGGNASTAAAWSSTRSIVYVFNRTVQAGDKLTLRIEHISGYQYRACYFHNQQLIHQATGTWTFAASERHGVTCTPATPSLPAVIGQWDNYACHVGNP
jgi:hypothetical protein